MSPRKKRIAYFIKFVGLLAIAFLFVNKLFAQESSDELLDQAFGPAMSQSLLLDMGLTKNAVGNEVFKEKKTITVDIENGIKASTEAPLIVRIAKFLLRMTIVLSITMILYNGVYRIVESIQGTDGKKAKSNLLYIVIGIILSLMSLGIISLISSVGSSTFTDGPNPMAQVN